MNSTLAILIAAVVLIGGGIGIYHYATKDDAMMEEKDAMMKDDAMKEEDAMMKDDAMASSSDGMMKAEVKADAMMKDDQMMAQ